MGSSLLMAFDTKSGIPSSTVNLHNPARKSMVNPLNGQKYNFGDPTTLAVSRLHIISASDSSIIQATVQAHHSGPSFRPFIQAI